MFADYVVILTRQYLQIAMKKLIKKRIIILAFKTCVNVQMVIVTVNHLLHMHTSAKVMIYSYLIGDLQRNVVLFGIYYQKKKRINY